MVLAAGRGSRLRPLTDRVPKPMIPVAERPLLEHGVRLLRQHGFDDLVINVSHLPAAIRDYFGDGSAFGVSIQYSYEDQLLGTAGALRPVAAHFADDDFLVHYADNLTNADISELWQAHRRHGPLATVGLVRMPDAASRGIVGIDAEGRIDRWVEKPKPDEIFDDFWINAGIYALRPDVLQEIPRQGAPDFALDLFPRLLASGANLRGHGLRGQLLSTDTPDRYAAARHAVDGGQFRLP